MTTVVDNYYYDWMNYCWFVVIVERKTTSRCWCWRGANADDARDAAFSFVSFYFYFKLSFNPLCLFPLQCYVFGNIQRDAPKDIICTRDIVLCFVL